MTRNVAGADQAGILKLGAWLAILGAIGYLTGLLWHRDLPDETIQIALDHIAQRPEWQFIHLLSIIAVLLWLGAFIAFTQTLSGLMSRVLGKMAVFALTVGIAVFIVDYSIDGHRLKSTSLMPGRLPREQNRRSDAWLRKRSSVFLAEHSAHSLRGCMAYHSCSWESPS